MRVTDFLADHEVPFETLVHPPAFTAVRLAKYLHVSVMKCVLLAAGKSHVVAVLPATRRLDWDALAMLFGPDLRLAGEDEIAAAFPDCERGSLSPFGSLYGLDTIVDESVPCTGQLVFPAQRHMIAVRLRGEDFGRLLRCRRESFSLDGSRASEFHANANAQAKSSGHTIGS